MRFFTRFGWLSDIQNWWGIIFWLFPSMGAGVSVWSAYILAQPLYIVIFYGSGAFCFLIFGPSQWSVWSRENTIYGKLKIDAFAVLIVKIPNDLVADCSLEIQNKSLFDIYYQLEEAELVLSGKTYESSKVDSAIMIVQSASSNRVTFGTIHSLKPEAMAGRMKLKLTYGKRKEFLNRRLEVVAEPLISVLINENGDVAAARSLLILKEVKHS